MSITYLKGDATKPAGEGPRFILHVCNDIGLWGAGFVMAVSRRWPDPEERYYYWHASGGGAHLPLGFIQPVKVDENLWVINMIAQRGVGTRYTGPDRGPPIRYDAVKTCLKKVAKLALDPKYRGPYKSVAIHAPYFGCGLAGGDWDIIEEIIQEVLVEQGLSVTIYEFDD